MGRFEGGVAWLGVITGLWGFVAAYSGIGGKFGILPLAVAVLLAVASFFCMVGPRVAFYGVAVISLLLGASMVLGASPNYIGAATIVLAIVTFALALVAARRRIRVSEQSHPMNLPVFG